MKTIRTQVFKTSAAHGTIYDMTKSGCFNRLETTRYEQAFQPSNDPDQSLAAVRAAHIAYWAMVEKEFNESPVWGLNMTA